MSDSEARLKLRCGNYLRVIKMMKRLLAVSIFNIFLVACGGSNSSGSSSATSLSDIVGVYDNALIENQAVDESYIVIKQDGQFIEYDYQGDSFDLGLNCYVIVDTMITDLGAGRFELSDDTGFSLEVGITHTENSFTLSFDNTSETLEMKRSILLENELTPQC